MLSVVTLHGGCNLGYEALGCFSNPRNWRISGRWRENKVLPENPQSKHMVL
jgi:hypothetical protein